DPGEYIIDRFDTEPPEKKEVNEGETDKLESNNDLNIPEDLRDKPWVKNIKTTEDLWKAHANAQQLIGKKTIGIPEFDKATDEELQDFYKKLTPEEYSFEEGVITSDEEKQLFSEIFKKNGINNKAANNIIKEYKENNKKYFSEENFQEEMRNRFGENYKSVLNQNQKILSSYLNDEDKQVLDQLPNKVLGLMINFTDKISKQYGVNHMTSKVEKSTTPEMYSKADYEAKVNEYIQADLSNKLNGEAKAEKIRELNNLRTKVKWS
ncbi:MAG: hypothetical protein ACOC1K_03325, partial [Nanoarchaeota archaeon]